MNDAGSEKLSSGELCASAYGRTAADHVTDVPGTAVKHPASFCIVALLCLAGHPGLLAFERHRAFERITEVKALRSARGVIAGDFNGDGRCDLGTHTSEKIGLQLQGAQLRDWELVMITPRSPIDTLVAFLANRDKSTDFLTVTNNRKSLQVYTGGTGRRFSPRWEFTLEEPFDDMLIADINSDGINDIMLWSRHTTGARVFPGKGNATFSRPVTFLQDLAIGTCMVTDIDGDGSSDVVVTDWVTNELSVMRGFRKMKLSEPLVFSLESEPSAFGFLPGSFESGQGLLVASRSDRRLTWYSALQDGGYAPSRTEPLPDGPVELHVQDFDNDGESEVLLNSPAASHARVWFRSFSNDPPPPILYGTGKSTVSCAPLVLPSGRCEGVAFLDSSLSMVRVFWTPGMGPAGNGDRRYALGPGPTSVITVNTASGRMKDIIVLHAGGMSYFEHSPSGLRGSLCIPSPSGPGRTIVLQRAPLVWDILSPHTFSDSLLITSVDFARSTSTASVIPTDAKSTIAAAFLPAESGKLSIYTLSGLAAGNNRSVTLYDQLLPGRFLERTLSLSGNVLDAVITDMNRDSIPDIVSLVSQSSGRGTMLMLHPITRGHTLGPLKQLQRLHDREIDQGFLWQKDMNRDGSPDLLLHVDGRDGSIGIALNQGDTTFAKPILVTQDRVTIASHEHVTTKDLNRDGYPDIILLNSRTRTIEAYLSTRKLEFQGPFRIMSSEGVAAFLIDDIELDGIFDVLLADSLRGYLRIISLEEVL